MSDLCYNRIIVVGLKSTPQAFQEELGQAMSVRDVELLEPLRVFNMELPRYNVVTRFGRSATDEICKASEQFPELVFLNDWIVSCGDLGQTVVQDGRIKGSILVEFGEQSYPELRHPYFDLLSPYMPLTLAQHGVDRFRDAIWILKHLREYVDEFTAPEHQSFRDEVKVESTRKILDELIATMNEASEELDFEGVFIDSHYLPPVETESER